MRRVALLVVLVLVLSLPALAQEVTPDVTPVSTPEVIDGSTPAPSVIVTVPDPRNDWIDLISLVVAIAVPAFVAIREITQTQDITSAFIGFLQDVTGNVDLTKRLQYEYLNADPKRKAIVELFLSLADTITELTPTERDKFVRDWTDYIRGIRAQREAVKDKTGA